MQIEDFNKTINYKKTCKVRLNDFWSFVTTKITEVSNFFVLRLVCIEFWIENPASINCSSLELPDILCEKDTSWRLEKIKHETKTKGLLHVFKSLRLNNKMVSATFRLQQSKRNFTLYNMATNLWFLGKKPVFVGKFFN